MSLSLSDSAQRFQRSAKRGSAKRATGRCRGSVFIFLDLDYSWLGDDVEVLGGVELCSTVQLGLFPGRGRNSKCHTGMVIMKSESHYS